MNALYRLSDFELRAIAKDLRAGRITIPVTALSLQEYCPGEVKGQAAVEIQQLSEGGMDSGNIGAYLEAIAEARTRLAKTSDSAELVWTGPELPGTTNRDTGVVVRELFAEARSEVLIAGFAVHQGKRIFQELAVRMDQNPTLRVRVFFNIPRAQSDTSASAEIIQRFVARFKNEEWPGKRLPEMFYDPRSLEQNAVKRASLHAKAIVVDGEIAFITSANFTEAAHERNIELGALVRSKDFASRVIWHFGSLADAGILLPVNL